jgi:hypothetical protein
VDSESSALAPNSFDLSSDEDLMKTDVAQGETHAGPRKGQTLTEKETRDRNH